MLFTDLFTSLGLNHSVAWFISQALSILIVAGGAAIPAIGLAGWAFGSLISGAVIVETIFARPGIGRSLLSAVELRDVPLVVGIVLVVALGYILMTTLTDLADRLVDPRRRRNERRGRAR